MVQVQIACGYLIQQDYMKNLFNMGHATDYNPSDLIHEVIKWRLDLPVKRRSGIPPIMPYAHDVNVGPTTCAFFVLTRIAVVRTPEDSDEKLLELEADKILKEKFVEVFGRGLQPNEMVFGMKVWRHHS